MTATVEAATRSNGQFQGEDGQAGQDEDETVRPNGFHLDQPPLAQAAQSSPDEMSNLPSVHVSPPSTPGLSYDHEHRASSPQSVTHTEITAGIADRSSRRRSIMDRNTRFSGFITNLIGRRDRDRDRDQEHPPQPKPGRASSPSQPPQDNLLRSLASAQRVAPPPPLPPPTLQELGLSLSVLTSNLSPSHFTTPPTNGAFLSPHYLLLCHSQGLDVLPLTRPPAPQPYALVRRVPFKSVVIMEERGVLVAIAGRRDGVRVYALEEIRKAVEWRIDVEVRRELDRMRREDAKRGGSGSVDNIFGSTSTTAKSKDSLFLPSSSAHKAALPTSTHTPTRHQPDPLTSPSRNMTEPRQPSPPPEYEEPPSTSRPRPRSTASGISVNPSLSHRGSVSTVVEIPGSLRRRGSAVPESRSRRGNEKSDVLTGAWEGYSDDEAISLVAAGPSGSAALDERTSSNASASRQQPAPIDPDGTSPAVSTTSPNPPALTRGRRPSNLDLSISPMSQVPNTSAPSPVPTLTTLRQTLSRSPQLSARSPTVMMDAEQPSEGEADGEADGEEATTPTGERISFAQALLESRLPNLPPPGTRQPQRPVFISASHTIVTGDEDSIPHSSNEGRPNTSSSISHATNVVPKTIPRKNDRSKRRRWSVLDGMFNTNAGTPSDSHTDAIPDPHRTTTLPAPAVPPRNSAQPLARSPSSSLTRSNSARSGPTSSASTPVPGLPRRPSRENPATLSRLPPDIERTRIHPSSRPTSSSNRFLPRIISNALSTRRSEESGIIINGRGGEGEGSRRTVGSSLYPQSVAPKLEYVKLPGTKGSVMIKAVETAKKSFLAILCGDAGEKVELFAGTYRTALGLSRTFILPDSPRNLELQLQGDDLVEVFLVFSHNIFGLEPATVRVREVRIGRAERRAARRRAREARTGEAEQVDGDSPPLEEDSGVSVTIGVALPPNANPPTSSGAETPTAARPNPVRRVTDSGDIPSSPAEPAAPTTSVTNPEDLVALAASQIGVYTTFQQLSFAPKFPLATLADECIIPPTYPSAVKHPKIRSNADDANIDVLQQQVLPPPGLPLPPSLPLSKWYYKDPKGVVQGPWKTSLMQSWY
ncbi:hypothetical protein JB92DRAFT_3051408, partial [Gautieria morchelliformis]